jgi:hypothetical protein
VTLPNGRTYNLDDQNERNQFFNDKLTLLTQARDEEISKGRKTSDQNLAQIDQEIQDTFSQAKTYAQEYQQNVNEFGEGFNVGNVKRQQMFAGLSPNAFQSSQGTSQAFAEGKYLEGLGQMAQEAQGNVGNAFLQNPNDINALGESTIYGRNIGQLQGQKVDVANAFNDYLNKTQQDVYSQAADISNQLSTNKPFTFNRSQIAAPTAGKADLTPYTPYTGFQQGNVNIPLTQSTKVYTPNAFTEQTPIDAFLGRNQLSGKQKDYLKSYLLAKA